MLCTFGCAGTCDATLVVGSTSRFSVHLGVLTSFIPWFASAHESGMIEARTREYTFPDDDPGAWQIVLQRIYSPRLVMTEDMAQKVLPVVVKYDISWLKEEAVQALSA